MITLTVDQKQIRTEPGGSLLQACLENDIYIPNLCYLEGAPGAAASCRLCYVEIQGEGRPVPACTQTAKDGMVIRTDTPAVRSLQRAALRLLLSAHEVDCAHCPANKQCALQRMAKFLKVGLRPKRLDPLRKRSEQDKTHPYLDYYPNRCVLCGRCVAVCQRAHKKPFLTFAGRGFHTVVSGFGESETDAPSCTDRLACVDVCPVAAILPRSAEDPPSNA